MRILLDIDIFIVVCCFDREVKVVTGEEDETVVASLPRAKLFAFEKKEEGSPGECSYP